MDLDTIAKVLFCVWCVLTIVEKLKDVIKWFLLLSVLIALAAVVIAEVEYFDSTKYTNAGRTLIEFVMKLAAGKKE